MAPSLKLIVSRVLFNFNAISLLLLAFQNAGYLVLMGYAQQQQDKPPGPGEPPKKRLSSSHFLAVTEFTKLLISIVWCMFDVLQDLRKEEQEALIANVEVAHDDDNVENADGFGADAQKVKSAFATREGLHPSGNNHPANSPAILVPNTPGSPSKPVMYDEIPITRLFSRPNFAAQLATRMRHAIGFDNNYKEPLLMIVPAVLYTIQGLLIILSLQLLDPTVFQILYQVRIMFLAVMMRVVLDFQLSPIRWAALVALMIGITLAQLAMQRNTAKPEAAEQTHKSWTIEGTITALAGAFLSSFSGVFMEFVFKKRGNHFTLSARNIHLAFFSLVYFWFVFARDIWKADDGLSASSKIGDFFSTFFDGFTGLVWFLVLLQAAGGILVALVVRYCDNIVKSFSTAFAIVLGGMASVFLFNLPLEPIFLLGSFLVMASITVYSLKK
jgi:solute carrier family 35 (UDP-sugar transporter), member A1/2/3